MNDTTEWTQRANCNNKTDLYLQTAFSASEIPRSPDDKQAVATAKQICISCPVRKQCLESALIEEKYLSGAERHGIRGGLTARERIFRAIEDPMCARCHENPIPTWDRVYHIRTVCRRCQITMQYDPALKYQSKVFGLKVLTTA